MVRVEFHEKNEITTMKIEGRFAGRIAADARSLVASRKTVDKLVVDLSELTSADEIGEKVLQWLSSIGCIFIAGNAYSRFICDALVLPQAKAMRSACK
jgi:hypothetical protein